MNITPLYDKVIILRSEEKITSSGIVIPETINEKPQRGIVQSTGSGKWTYGVFQKMTVKKGDEVLFPKYSGTEIKINGKDMIVIKEEDIIGIISK